MTKNHAADPEKGFLTKLMSKPYGNVDSVGVKITNLIKKIFLPIMSRIRSKKAMTAITMMSQFFKTGAQGSFPFPKSPPVVHHSLFSQLQVWSSYRLDVSKSADLIWEQVLNSNMNRLQFHELLKLRYLKNVPRNFWENFHVGTVFDALSSPGFTYSVERLITSHINTILCFLRL